MCIKKLTSILVVMALLLASGGMAGQAVTVSQEQEANFAVNLEIASSYDLSIPASTTFSLANKSAMVTVNADAVLASEEKLNVYLEHDGDGFRLSYGTASIDYTIKAFVSGTSTEIPAGTRENSVFVGSIYGDMGSQTFSTDLKFSLPSEFNAKNYSRGTYTQNLTFRSWIETDS